MIVAEIQVEKPGSKLIVSKEDLPSQLDMIFDGEVGSEIFITLAEMTEEEYRNLEEFTGW